MVAPDVWVLLWPSTESASRRERQPSLVCVCVCFCSILTKRALQRMTKVVLSPSQRPPDVLKEQSMIYVSQQSELLSIFSWDGLLLYLLFKHAGAHTPTRRATFYPLYVTRSSFKSFFIHIYDTIQHSDTLGHCKTGWGSIPLRGQGLFCVDFARVCVVSPKLLTLNWP